jgi:hypothetical protein
MLLVYVLLSLQLFLQTIQIALLIVRSAGEGHFHLLGRIIKLALGRVDASQSRMHEPLIGMLLRVFTEDGKRLFIALFRLQLASE